CQDRGELQRPRGGNHAREINSGNRAEVPNPPARTNDAEVVPEVTHIAATAGLAVAAHEQHKADVRGEETDTKPLGPTEVTKERLQSGAEDKKTDIDDEARSEDQPERYLVLDKRQGGELRGAGVHQQRHERGERFTQPRLDDGDACDEAPRSRSDERGTGIPQTKHELSAMARFRPSRHEPAE